MCARLCVKLVYYLRGPVHFFHPSIHLPNHFSYRVMRMLEFIPASQAIDKCSGKMASPSHHKFFIQCKYKTRRTYWDYLFSLLPYFNTDIKINTTTLLLLFDLLKIVNYFWVQLHSDPSWLLSHICSVLDADEISKLACTTNLGNQLMLKDHGRPSSPAKFFQLISQTSTKSALSSIQ